MKKFISLILSVLFMMSVSVTGFASEREATPDSAEIETQIKKDASEYLYNGNISVDDIMVTVFGTLSDGSMLVNVFISGSHNVTYMDKFADYVYSYQPGNQVYIYKKNTFCFIVDAYYDGMLDDSMIKEILKLREETMKNLPNSKSFNLCPFEDPEGQIIKDASEYFLGGKLSVDDITLAVFGTLSDGSLLVKDCNGGVLEVALEYTLGNYVYSYQPGDQVYLYKNNTFRFIIDAYNDGMISDSMLKEISILSEASLKNFPESHYFLLCPIEPDATDVYPTEAETQATSAQLTDSTTQAQPTTQPVTVAVAESTTGDVTNTTKPGTAFNKIINNNSNGAVQTGQNSVILFVFVMTVISAALVFALIKRRYYK